MTDYPYSFTALIEVNLGLKNYETARNLLQTIKEDVNGEDYPYSAATISALEVIYDLRTGRDISKSAKRLSSILEEYGFANLDICDPNLLEEVCNAAGIDSRDKFPV